MIAVSHVSCEGCPIAYLNDYIHIRLLGIAYNFSKLVNWCDRKMIILESHYSYIYMNGSAVSSANSA